MLATTGSTSRRADDKSKQETKKSRRDERIGPDGSNVSITDWGKGVEGFFGLLVCGNRAVEPGSNKMNQSLQASLRAAMTRSHCLRLDVRLIVGWLRTFDNAALGPRDDEWNNG